MVTTHDMISAYLTRLEELVEDEDHVKRYFLFLDEDLADMEYELSNSDQSGEFYDQLLNQFRTWKAEMSEAQWQEVIAYNESQDGANQNDLLYEV